MRKQLIKSIRYNESLDFMYSYGIKWLQNMNIFIDPKCENLIQELSDYTWVKTKDGIYIEKTVGKDDGIDSLRYATEIMRLNNKITFLPKSALGIY